MSIDRAHLTDIILPPVKLLKLGGFTSCARIFYHASRGELKSISSTGTV